MPPQARSRASTGRRRSINATQQAEGGCSLGRSFVAGRLRRRRRGARRAPRDPQRLVAGQAWALAGGGVAAPKRLTGMGSPSREQAAEERRQGPGQGAAGPAGASAPRSLAASGTAAAVPSSLPRSEVPPITSMPPIDVSQSEQWATVCHNKLCAVDLRPATRKVKRPQSDLMMAHAFDKARALRALEPTLGP